MRKVFFLKFEQLFEKFFLSRKIIKIISFFSFTNPPCFVWFRTSILSFHRDIRYICSHHLPLSYFLSILKYINTHNSTLFRASIKIYSIVSKFHRRKKTRERRFHCLFKRQIFFSLKNL